MKIYLAGGMRPRVRERGDGSTYFFNWQDEVVVALGTKHHVMDPRVHDTKVFEEYSFLDLLRIRQCDLVIGYIERENPSAAGLIAEMAYAKGLGKSTLLINEKDGERYIKFVENFADIVFNTLEEALPVITRI